MIYLQYLMIADQHIPQEYLRIMERLYIFVDTKDVELNNRLNLVVNPEIIKILFKRVQTQNEPFAVKLLIFKKLSKIYSSNRFNSLILWKRDKQIIQINHSILQSIIHFVFSFKSQVKQGKQVSDLIVPFAYSYPINGKIIKTILSMLIKDFYEEKNNHTVLQLSIFLLRNLLKQQKRMQEEPCNYFITYGWETGIKMINRNIKWPFSKGFYFYLKFYIQDYINEDMILFNLSIQQDQFIIYITPQGILKVKIFSTQHILQICSLNKERWITMSLSYIIKSKLLRNCYELVCNIDGDIFQRRDLPVPAISMSDEIVELTLGNRFYGKIHSVILSRTDLLLGNKLIMNTWNEIQSFLVINKKSFREVFIFYNPILTTNLNNKELVYDISSQNHGEMFQNTGIHQNPFREVDINYYGGLYTYIPLVHLLKFYEYEKYPEALTDIFELFLVFFQNKFINVQSYAINCQFFSIVCQLINEINPNFLRVDTVKVIKKINSHLTNMQLRKEMLVNFLFKINIRKIQHQNVICQLHEIICHDYFTLNFEESINLISLDDIIHYIINNFQEEKKEMCCLHHFCYHESDKDEIELKSFKNNYLIKTNQISRLLKIVLTNLASCKELRPIRTKITQVLFYEYSSCLKLLLLQALNQGIKVNSRYFIEDLNIVLVLHCYIQKTQLPEELALLIQILLNCQEQDKTNLTIRNGNIQVIAASLDKIYSKKCEEGRFRGKTGAIKTQIVTVSKKHASAQKNQSKTDKSMKDFTKKSWNMRQKNSPIESNRSLYEAVIKMCFEFNIREETWLLKNDQFCQILQPYFRICCIDYRRNIINMIRCTVFSAIEGKKINSQSNQFNRLYKLLLTQFILKELQPEGNQMVPSNLSNDIILNFYFVIDYTVISMREDWLHLYMYLLRLSGIMEQAKKEIALKYLKSTQDLSIASKISSRKFAMRVVKSAEKNIFNFSNCIFLIFIIVTNIQNIKKNCNLFQYFKSIQKYMLVGRTAGSQMKNKVKFLDANLIIQTVNSFKLWKADESNVAPIDLLKYDWKQRQKIINAYLDLQYTKQSSQLYKNRLMYLIKAEFKTPRNKEHPLKDLFVGSQNRKMISTGQIIGTLLCLCIEISLSTSDMNLFNQAISSLNNFVYWFLLLSSRDGLKLEKHSERNIQLPKTIIYKVLHFLYFMLSCNYDKFYISVIQDTIYGIFCFLGLIIRCLSQKVGFCQNIEKVLQKAAVMKSLEQYSFFTFELFKTVLALKDLKLIPDISKEKVMKVIYHPKVMNYFKNDTGISIQSKIQEISKDHQKNQQEVKKKLEEFFSKEKNINLSNEVAFNEEEFKKNFAFQHVKKNNLEYRKTQKIWMKIWKRLRLYHYFWSISINQREQNQLNFLKNARLPYRHKLSKFVDTNGARPVLEVEHIQPWHVKKVLMQKQYEYRNSNYLLSLHQQIQTKRKEKSFIEKLIKPQQQSSKFYVNWIKHNSKRKGYVTIQKQKIKFQYESTFQKDSHLEFSSFILAEHKPVEKYWPLVEITNIYERRYLTQRHCLLIEFEEGTSLIFNFINEDKDDFMRLIFAKQNKTDKTVLMRLNKINFYTKKFDLQCTQAIEEANTLWKNHKISNFQYLMLINKFAGRSYLDPANYPVFPWVIANYEYQRYKYRDLSKTVGALGNQQRIKFYHNKLQANDPFDPVPPYQFGTHYSSPGTVFGFLIRLQPYTQASRTLQGGKFDLPDRLFSSVKVCWHSVTTEVSDVRQLTPQFYYLPQFLLNIEHHDFGLTQQKERVHNVQLPIWAKNAYQFIVTQRKQLQSDYVSENIGNWIDLIFGYKQKGKIAEENLNLFYYLTYEDAIDLKEIKDDQTRISNEAQIMHFGQTPTQIFTRPHGGRPKSKKLGFGLKKISLVLTLQNTGPMTILGIKENKLFLFHDYTLLICQQQITYSVQRQIRILRNNSKENIYFLQDIEFYKRVQIFNNQRYIAIASYINGDLIIFSLTDGRKVQEKKGTAKLCLHISEKEDLLLIGNRNGLLQVYQIVYGQKETLTLVKIAAEYYMAPIYSISQGGRFFCIASGSMVTLIRASRALNYVYDKSKMRGVKMIRSIQVSKKVERCIISTDPLFCFIICTELQLYCYSGNGQLLASKQVALTFPPVKFTQNFMDYLAYLQNNRLKIVSLPFFTDIRDLQLPNKNYVQIKIFENKCFLVTNLGQIITLGQQPEEIQ